MLSGTPITFFFFFFLRETLTFPNFQCYKIESTFRNRKREGEEKIIIMYRATMLNMAVFFWYLIKSVTSKMSSVTRFVPSQSKVAALSRPRKIAKTYSRSWPNNPYFFQPNKKD